MKDTNYTKHKRMVSSIKKKIDVIQAKYPGINLYSAILRRDVKKFHELFIELITEQVNMDYCRSDDPDRMCTDCTCWKNTRKQCS